MVLLRWRKNEKKILLICVLVVLLSLTACGGKSSTSKKRTIEVNEAKQIISFFCVTYYDFLTNTKLYNTIGKNCIVSNSTNNTAVVFIDSKGVTRCAKTNTALSNKLKTVLLYTNSKMTEADMYNCNYDN